MSDPAEPTFDEDQFASTIVRVFHQGKWLEIHPDASAVTSPIAVRLPSPLHVISGCNPGYRADEAENERRHTYMEERLKQLGVDPIPAVGMSPDGTWVEPSWAVSGLTRDQVCELGRAFGQVAVFEIDVREVSVIQCRDGIAVSVSTYGLRQLPDQ